MPLPSTTYDTATLVNPTAALTDFTLIVDLSRMSASWWAAVDTTDATKGRAAKDDGTELACDWIDFDDVGETGWLRVKWSGTLATSGTQTLRVYPPVAANLSYAASDTYGSDNAYDSNWVFYWPFEEDPSGTIPQAIDRTANNHDGVSEGSMTSADLVAGQIGSGWDFDGTDDNVRNTTASLVANSQVTIMQWANIDPTKFVETTFGGYATFELALRHTDPAGKLEFVLNSFSTNDRVQTTSTFSAGPAMVGGRFDGSTLDIILNGAVDGSVTPTGTWAGQSGFRVGTFSNVPGANFSGWIDETQLHSIGRPDAWIAQEYNQTNDQASFWGTWTNVPVSGGGGVTPSPLVSPYLNSPHIGSPFIRV